MLDLDSNHISKIPALPPSLEVLKLNHNKLNSLPLDSFKGVAAVGEALKCEKSLVENAHQNESLQGCRSS